MKNKITTRELAFSVACFIHGSILLSSYSISISKQENWITLLVAYFISIGIVFFYSKLIKKYPEKSLFFINNEVFGNRGGKIISGIYLFYLLSLTALNLRHISDFLATWIMMDTPIYALMIVFMFAVGYAVKNGIERLTRFSFVLLFLTYLIVLLTLFFLAGSVETQNFLPLLSLTPLKYVQSTHMLLISPFCETLVFLLLAPKFNSPEKSMKAFSLGLTLGMLPMLAFSIFSAGVLGNAEEILAQPIYEMVRFINIFDVFTRIEIIFAFFVVTMQFFKVSICCHASSIGIKEIFGVKNEKTLVYILGAFIVCYALIVFSSGVELGNWRKNTSPFFTSIFEIILPLLTLFVATVKKKGERIK